MRTAKCVERAGTKYFRIHGASAHDGSAMPGSVADACARVWLAKCVIAMLDIIDVDCTERRLRLLQGRASLNLDKLILRAERRR